MQLCPLPVPALCPAAKDLPVMQNTVAVGAVLRLMGLDFAGLESVLKTTFAKKPQVVAANVDAAQAGFDYAARNFQPAVAPAGGDRPEVGASHRQRDSGDGGGARPAANSTAPTR